MLKLGLTFKPNISRKYQVWEKFCPAPGEDRDRGHGAKGEERGDRDQGESGAKWNDMYDYFIWCIVFFPFTISRSSSWVQCGEWSKTRLTSICWPDFPRFNVGIHIYTLYTQGPRRVCALEVQPGL